MVLLAIVQIAIDVAEELLAQTSLPGLLRGCDADTAFLGARRVGGERVTMRSRDLDGSERVGGGAVDGGAFEGENVGAGCDGEGLGLVPVPV